MLFRSYSTELSPQNGFDLTQQSGTFFARCPPYFVPIDPEIGMHEYVAKGHYLGPRHIWVAGFEFVGNPGCRLADHGGLLCFQQAMLVSD